ncbi:MAG TPA: MauE/DoxX family redox-associated membrane protein [Acidimicrobiales bacterium]|nr:MauE/DoxX family redox-associated membrane protein [Acidimicrobiales bacterium]
MELIGVYFVACGLLVAAGAAKALRPADSARAMVLLAPDWVPLFGSLRYTREAVRIGALAEAALGAVALMFPRSLTAALVAASYAVFVVVVAYAHNRGGALATCGCFGRPDTPATRLHVAVNVVLFAAALLVAVRPPDATSFFVLLDHQPWLGLPLLFVSGVGVWVTYLALSPLAALEGARRLVQGRSTSAVTTS